MDEKSVDDGCLRVFDLLGSKAFEYLKITPHFVSGSKNCISIGCTRSKFISNILKTLNSRDSQTCIFCVEDFDNAGVLGAPYFWVWLPVLTLCLIVCPLK